MKYKDSSLFIHKQLIRFLMEANMRIPLKDLITYLQKLITGCPNDAATRSQLLPVYEMFLTRLGQRLNEHHVPFLYDYLQKQPQLKQPSQTDAHFGSQYTETSPPSSSPRETPHTSTETRPSPHQASPKYSQPSPKYSQPSPKYIQTSPPRYSQPSPKYSQPSPSYSSPPPYNQPSPKYSQASPDNQPSPHSQTSPTYHPNIQPTKQQEDTVMEDINPKV
jgi:DNA-directed RNA polymerase II subunit RPB1/leucine proline-enriched proteoglycan (leprecan)